MFPRLTETPNHIKQITKKQRQQNYNDQLNDCLHEKQHLERTLKQRDMDDYYHTMDHYNKHRDNLDKTASDWRTNFKDTMLKEWEANIKAK